MHLTAADIALKPRSFYDELDVQLKLGQEVGIIGLYTCICYNVPYIVCRLQR